ncbi:MAG: hypothetical protein UW04_C0042G0004 [Parcubacteria group bacterium GW2011_GWB1_43_8]|nr:MAG: hypothetical protein UW04_C0042G0004 [Parcubacteria group bacterium GW2011_GWB1_43_8]
MLMTQNQVTPYDFEENRKNIEELLTGFEYCCNFDHIVCVNMACFETYYEEMLSELQFFNKKENLFVFYEKIKEGEDYDADKQIRFLKEKGFLCTTNCLCVGVPLSQTMKRSFKDSLKKANFVV